MSPVNREAVKALTRQGVPLDAALKIVARRAAGKANAPQSAVSPSESIGVVTERSSPSPEVY
jgi:hypothetical protein